MGKRHQGEKLGGSSVAEQILRRDLCETSEDAGPKHLTLDGVSAATLIESYRWSMMEKPQLRLDASFEEVNALAEPAEKYEIHALRWQTLDRIRQQLFS